LLGTLYPIVLEAFGGDRVSVGTPYFDRVAIPVAFLLLMAMGVGPVTPWRYARGPVVWRRVATPVLAGLIAGAVAVLIGVDSIPVVVIVILAVFVAAGIVRELVVQVGKARDGNAVAGVVGRVLRRDPGFWGGQIAHLGVAVLAVGIAASSGLATRGEVALATGESAPVSGYCVRYDGPTTRSEPNRLVQGAQVSLLTLDCTSRIAALEPVFNTYARPPSVAKPAVDVGLKQDVFVALAQGSVPGDQVVLDVYVFPLIWMVWLGGMIVAAGGVWAIAARKSRRSLDRSLDAEPARV